MVILVHPSEIDDVMKTFTIYVDSLEKPTERSRLRYKQFGCPYKTQRLNFGDYGAVVYLPNGSLYEIPAKIERKANWTEICGNFTHERDRFVREFERAKDANQKIILLIEDTLEKAYAGKYRSQMLPQALVASLFTWLARYDCQLILCKSELSGRVIKDLLYREAREALERMVDE